MDSESGTSGESIVCMAVVDALDASGVDASDII